VLTHARSRQSMSMRYVDKSIGAAVEMHESRTEFLMLTHDEREGVVLAPKSGLFSLRPSTNRDNVILLRLRSDNESTRSIENELTRLRENPSVREIVPALIDSDGETRFVVPGRVMPNDFPAVAHKILLERHQIRGQGVCERRMHSKDPHGLSAVGGFQDSGFNLASLPNSLWTIGASAVLPLFEGGLRRAELQRSWSQYAQARDSYRSTVLRAFQEVEDGLALTLHLQEQTQQQATAVAEAYKAQALTLQLYIGGLTNYLDVVVAQETALTARIAEVQVQVSRLQAAVTLIRALGGGWSAADLPTEDGVLPFGPLDYTDIDYQPRPDGAGQGTGAASEPP